MDVLADLLAITHLQGDALSHSLCDPPWGLRYPAAGHVWFHVLARGGCKLVVGTTTLALAAGDLVLLPHGTGHTLCDSPRSKCYDVDVEWLRKQSWPLFVSTGPATGGERAEILCGNYRVGSASTHPALRALPTTIHIPAGAATLTATTQTLWAELASGDLGARAIVSRLLEVLFVQILRHWVDAQPAGSTSWLGAVRDAPIGNALGLIHASPERAWTVASLAREVGLSRPVFARRFVEHLGEPPMSYLRRVRVERAEQLLDDTDASLAAIAAASGYASEYAFNRAFRRVRGVPPGRYRKRRT